MFKKNLALALMGMFAPQLNHRTALTASNVEQHRSGLVGGYYSGKGQLRAAQPKSSGAAQFKRAAKKRNNIRKHG